MMTRDFTRRRARCIGGASFAVAALFVTGSMTAVATPPGKTISVMLSSGLSVQGTFFVPKPISVNPSLAVQGNFFVPKPVSMNASLSVTGNFTLRPLPPRKPQ